MLTPARWLLAGVLMCALVPAPGLAQTNPGRSVSFGIGGGVSVPLSDARDALENGFNGDAFVRLEFGRLPISIRADVAYQSFGLRSLPQGTIGGTATLLGGLGSAQVYVLSGALRPYLLAGLGAYSVKTEPDGPGAIVSTNTRFAVDGGVGLLFTFGGLSLYAESRVDRVFTEKGQVGADHTDIVPVSCGVIF